MNECLEDNVLLTQTHLLWSENCPPHLTNLMLSHLHLHYPAKLSHLAGDVNDVAQGLEAEGMWTVLEKWTGQTHPWFSLLYCHLHVRDWAWVERKPQVGLHGYLPEKGGGIQNPITRSWAACQGPRMEEARKKNSTYLRARPTWVILLNLEVVSFLV